MKEPSLQIIGVAEADSFSCLGQPWCRRQAVFSFQTGDRPVLPGSVDGGRRRRVGRLILRLRQYGYYNQHD